MSINYEKETVFIVDDIVENIDVVTGLFEQGL